MAFARLLPRLAFGSRAASTARPLLFSNPGIPSPDLVHMYLEEAGSTDSVDIQFTNVNKMKNRGEDFLAINPLGEVPALRLSDGSTVVSESMAIVKYLDAYNTDGAGTSLVGTTAEERAETDMWCGRVDEKFLFPFGVAFRCGPMAEWFKDRRPDFILPDAAPPMVEMAQAGLAWLDSGAALGDGRPFLCGDRFTVADMRLFTYYRFVAKIHKAQRAPEALAHFHAYIERVAGRDSVAAIAPKKK